MQIRRFAQVDVFTATPARGNALAVVIDADGLGTEDMQAFAAWTNLAETTFLLPPTDPAADYRLRIFTPMREMRFAGHPTLGSCAVWLASGGAPRDADRVRQQCDIGIVEIDQTGPTPAFVAPPTEVRAMDPDTQARIMDALGLAPDQVLRTAHLCNGPDWQALELDSAATVLAVQGKALRYPEFLGVGLIGAHPPGADCAYEVRMLAPSSGMVEDPITGSLNAALAHWLDAQGRVTQPYVVAQGTSIGRAGRVYVSHGPDGILIGGQTHLLINGTLTL